MDNSFKSLKEFLEYVASGKKFTRKNWDADCFAYLKDYMIINQYGVREDIHFESYNTYKPYIEPKNKKRYWLWNIKEVFWYRGVIYMDENGINTNGDLELSNWDSLEKQKLENEFIEIEVDTI